MTNTSPVFDIKLALAHLHGRTFTQDTLKKELFAIICTHYKVLPPELSMREFYRWCVEARLLIELGGGNFYFCIPQKNEV